MNVYFVRHGESEGNKKLIAQNSETPLSSLGKKQAGIVAERLKKIPIDIICSSPYLRAKQTAEIIAKRINKPIEYWDVLKERKRPTEIEGLPISHPKVVKIDKHIEKNRHIPHWKYSDDESYSELFSRASKIINHLLEKHRNQNIICVSHSGIMKMIIFSAILQEKITPDIFWQIYYHLWSSNTGVTQLEYTEKYRWGLLSWNDTTHL
jgi:broad specificity phosphatase PhoE